VEQPSDTRGVVQTTIYMHNMRKSDMCACQTRSACEKDIEKTCGLALSRLDSVQGYDGKVVRCLQDFREELQVGFRTTRLSASCLVSQTT